ncbi:uncharacterized protein N7482_006369 [Penicillium canariense]|uniref:DUF7136 domain-containing protein n=1 Tax=Penicillium canariense TaxID=189055 RepID=A0A9W9LIW9_9EURO|nr:uncharacterized protein N7482_006369 [Penicillium canariense]KAJ5159365.1 hypothetical protein N7482_006369 [Penicillium canariense]
MFPSNIAACLLLALSIGWSSAQNLPSIAEVDLLFPRNDTYAPTVLMPLVFGIQNPSAAVPLHLSLWWNLWQLEGGNMTGYGVIPKAYYIPTGARQYYEYSSFYDLTTIEGTWLFQWHVDSVNCSQFPANNYSMGSYTQGKRIIFTTKNGAQAPDLVTATADDVCASAEGFTFNVTGLEKVSIRSPDNPDGKDSVTTCADVVPMSPTYRPNPCAAQLNATGASSISLALTTTACWLPSSVVSCPAKSAGSLKGQLGGPIWAVATFGWLLYSLVR